MENITCTCKISDYVQAFATHLYKMVSAVRLMVADPSLTMWWRTGCPCKPTAGHTYKQRNNSCSCCSYGKQGTQVEVSQGRKQRVSRSKRVCVYVSIDSVTHGQKKQYKTTRTQQQIFPSLQLLP